MYKYETKPFEGYTHRAITEIDEHSVDIYTDAPNALVVEKYLSYVIAAKGKEGEVQVVGWKTKAQDQEDSELVEMVLSSLRPDKEEASKAEDGVLFLESLGDDPPKGLMLAIAAGPGNRLHIASSKYRCCHEYYGVTMVLKGVTYSTHPRGRFQSKIPASVMQYFSGKKADFQCPIPEDFEWESLVVNEQSNPK
jgi:hypothetical protein